MHHERDVLQVVGDVREPGDVQRREPGEHAVALSPVVQCNAIAPSQFYRSDDGANDALRRYRGEPLADGDTYRLGTRFEFRNGNARDVAEAILYLATCTSYLTGVTLRLDGGKALY